MWSLLEKIRNMYDRNAEKDNVLHAFQEKSKTGIKTPREDVDLIGERLKRAQSDCESRNQGGK